MDKYKYCYNCFYSRTEKTKDVVRLICCCLNSSFMWEEVEFRNGCCCWESMDYEKGKVNICSTIDEVEKVKERMIDEIKEKCCRVDNGVSKKENINHPERYNKYSMECIDEMVEVFGIDAVIGFCKCNVWKYRYRSTCEDDLKKGDWYMEKLKELNSIKMV